jgi:hypothetical protein
VEGTLKERFSDCPEATFTTISNIRLLTSLISAEAASAAYAGRDDGTGSATISRRDGVALAVREKNSLIVSS